MAARGPLWKAGLVGFGLLLFVVAEVAALIWVSGEIGWWTLALLMGSTLLGLFLLQREWRKAWGSLSEAMRSGQLPSGRMADATLVLVGGILLVLPGLLTDIIGLILLLPFTRPFVRSAITWWATRTLQRSGDLPTVIKGDVVDEPRSETLIPGITVGSPSSPSDGDDVVHGTVILPDDGDEPPARD